MHPRHLREFSPAENILPEFIPEGIHSLIQFQLPLKLLGTHTGKEIILLVRLPAEAGYLDTQLA